MVKFYLKYFILYALLCWFGLLFELYFVLEPIPVQWHYGVVPLLLVAIFAYFPAKIAAQSQKALQEAKPQNKKSFVNFDTKKESRLKIDKLTNAISKDSFNEIIGFKIIESKHMRTPLSMVMFDIDYFKKINDKYGHLVGDTTLKELSDLVRSNLRESEYFVRWGGEEFIILLPGTSMDGAKMVAEKLRRAVEGYQFTTVGRVTCSFGVTALRVNDTINSLLERCDEALYEAKENGRNQVRVKI